MDFRRTTVLFACARVRRAPTTPRELVKQFAIQRQLLVMRSAAQHRGLGVLTSKADVSTTPGTRFLERPAFLEALALAKAQGAALLIEDLGTLVRHLDSKDAVATAIAVASLDVPIIEAATHLVLNNCDPKLLMARMALAQASRQQRAKHIQAGVRKPRAKTDAKAASLRAAQRRTNGARQNARRLMPMV